MSQEMKLLVERALECAKKYGAQDAFASVSHGQSVDITWRKKKVENMSSTGTSALSLDLYVDGRYSAHSTSDLRDASIDAFIKRCVEVTRLLEPDAFRGLADPSKYEERTTADLEMTDASIEKMTPEDLITMSRELEDAANAHSEAPIQDVSCGASYDRTAFCSATSNGFFGERSLTSVSNYTEVVLKSPDGKIPSDYSFSYSHHKAHLLPSKTVSDDAVKRALRCLNQKKLPTKARTALFDNRAAVRLMNHYLEPISGGAIDQKQSYFLGKLGQRCGSSLLTLVDMPHIPGGPNSRAYDNEGMSTHDRVIFEGGVLKQYNLSNYYARKLKLDVTSSSFTNLVMPNSKDGKSLEELIKDVEDGILITGFLGGNKDSVRGDFSYGIIGIAIEHGELTTPVSEMNINGNFTTLWDNLTAVGNDPNLYSSYMIPSLRIDNVVISGS